MTSRASVKTPRKLIEVALPLDAINTAAAREKSIRHGHPSTLHLWWARRPSAAARAVIFGQMVNDPSWKWELERAGEVPPNNLKASWAASRKRLFSILEELVKWENTTNEDVLEKARAEIRRSWLETCDVNRDHPQAAELFNPDALPAFYDPFAGGGTLPLEAQRLGLEAYASDLNPVAVLINKAMIEIPPKFSGRPPVNPEARAKKDLLERHWKGAQGLAEDVRYYGQWMRDEAYKRIGHLYPLVEITAAMAIDRPDLKSLVGQRLQVVAWIWARTVKSPNPAFSHVSVPLVSSFVLSSKAGSETWAEPVVEGDRYAFRVRHGAPPSDATLGTRAGKAEAFICLLSKTPIPRAYVQKEGKADRLGRRLMAVVVETEHGRTIVSPTEELEHVDDGLSADPVVVETRASLLSGATPTRAMITGGVCSAYGLKTWGDLFTPRQIRALTTFSDLVSDALTQVATDCVRATGNAQSNAAVDVVYAQAVATYLAFGVSRAADYWSSGATWESSGGFVSHVFTKQALPMVWDYAESNPFSGGTGNWSQTCMEWIVRVVRDCDPKVPGVATQAAAQEQRLSTQKVVSTDPPYFNNISYAILADYFYAWLRRSLKPIYPELFATVSTPKAEELVASNARHDGQQAAESFFLDGMTTALASLSATAHPAYPVTIYYAYKQAATGDSGTSSAGWERFLEATLNAGFAISGTWPIRTERANRSVSIKKNALASSIVLVCHPRPGSAATTSKRAFQRELNEVLPEALDEMTKGAGDSQSPVAPVDLSQAIIGPGMAVFSKYSAVLEADGTPMSVRTALQLINRFLAEDDFDHDTQFCLHWFEQHGWRDGTFGDADTLARAKGTSVDGVKQAGVLFAVGGIVRLLKWSDYPGNWDPSKDPRLPMWEALHQLIRVFKTDGETGAGVVLAAIHDKGEAIRQLAYRLYTLSERAGWADDARGYNEIVTSWSAIESAAAATPLPRQSTLFG
jgi:putative DNA methylase